MNKKELKWYVSPEVEILELDTQTSLLAVSVEEPEYEE